MRLCGKDVGAAVGAAPGSNRPVRLRIGGNTYAMTTGEAVELATLIADVIERTNNPEGTEQ